MVAMVMNVFAGLRGKPRSRVTVGFHRIGIFLAAPFVVAAVVAAVWQWRDPSGRLVLFIPENAVSWKFGEDNTDPTAKQIMARERDGGFDLPDGVMLLGVPLGIVRQNDTDWSRYQLPNNEEIDVASTDVKKNQGVLKDFLLAQAKNLSNNKHAFTQNDTLSFEGVPVAVFKTAIEVSDDDSSWYHHQRDWTTALITLCGGPGIYVVMRALRWIVNGFTARS